MYNPVRAWLNYVCQDLVIEHSELQEPELKRLNRDAWAHQLIVAPITAFTLIGAITCLTSDAEWWGAMYATMYAVSYSVYARYGFRKVGIFKRRQHIRESGLECRVDE